MDGLNPREIPAFGSSISLRGFILLLAGCVFFWKGLVGTHLGFQLELQHMGKHDEEQNKMFNLQFKN